MLLLPGDHGQFLVLPPPPDRMWSASGDHEQFLLLPTPPPPNLVGCKQFAFAIRAKLGLTPKWMLARTPMPAGRASADSNPNFIAAGASVRWLFHMGSLV